MATEIKLRQIKVKRADDDRIAHLESLADADLFIALDAGNYAASGSAA